jgi:hypothetical protein
MNRAVGRVAGAILISALALCSAIVSAHPTQFTTLQVAIDPSGVYRGTLNIDILSYALGQTSQDTSNEQLQALLDAPRATLARDLADAGQRFQREFVIRTDAGDAAPTTWNLPGLPEVNAVLARHLQPPILMPGEIDFSGRLPAGARTVAFRLPYIMGDTVQVYEMPNGDSHDEPVVAGGVSSAVELGMTVPPEAVNGHMSFVRAIEVAGGLVAVLLMVGWWWRASRRKPRIV